MKTNALLFWGGVLLTTHLAMAQPTTFTYQGRLDAGGEAAAGSYDLQFTLHDAITGGGSVGNPVSALATPVTNGLFTVVLDFGPAAFDGSLRFLEMAVRPAGSTNAFVTLAPRQLINSAPYAMQAGTASALRGTLADSQLSGNIPRLNGTNVFTGPVSFLPDSGAAFSVSSDKKIQNLNADKLDSLDSTAFWKTFGNSGTGPTTNFLGTLDNQPLDFRVNGLSAMRLDTNGNVGIGTVTPGYKLDIAGNATLTTTSGSGQLNISNPSTTPADVAAILFASQGTRHAQISSGQQTVYGNDGFLAFATRNNSDGLFHEQLRIDNSGNVGIGTANPQRTLSVNGVMEGTSGRFGELTSVTNPRTLTVYYNNSYGNGTDGAGVLQAVRIGAGYNPIVLNPQGGNVGIGTTTPQASLDVAGNGLLINGGDYWTTDNWLVRLKSPISSTWRTTTTDNDGKYLGFGMAGDGWYFIRSTAANGSGSPEYPMVIKGSGNVGIGTTIPQAKLHVLDAAGANVLIGGASSDVTDRLGFVDGAYGIERPANQATLRFYSAGRFVWAVGGSEVMRLDQLGNVGIGTTAPASRLSIYESKTNTGTVAMTISQDYANTDSGTDYTKALDINKFKYDIPDGVIANGYQIGISPQVFVSDTRFSGTIDNQYAVWARSGMSVIAASGARTINNAYGIYIDGLTAPGGTIRHHYGVYQTGSGTKNYFQGNVGIGTTTPGAALEVANPSGSLLRLTRNDGTGFFGLNVSSAMSGSSADFFLTPGQSNSGVVLRTSDSTGTLINALGIDRNGRVGIRTTAPQETLHVVGSIMAEGTGGGGRVTIRGAAPGGHQYEWYPDSPAAGDLGLYDRTAGYDRLVVKSSGNVGIGTGVPQQMLDVAGNIRCVTLVQTSDRNAKENFVPVDAKTVLEKVAEMPISRWNFKKLPGTEHIGPMAQDFNAAFGVGPDDKHIATVDADGVALAAIQGLNQKLESQLKEKDAKITTLESRLADLEKLVASLANKGAR